MPILPPHCGNLMAHPSRLTVTTQNIIGWKHLLKGQFSHHCLQQCQQLHIYLDPDIDSAKNSGKQWLKRILNRIWTSLWQVWLLRNNYLHGRDRQ
jgi:hypothetical protein